MRAIVSQPGRCIVDAWGLFAVTGIAAGFIAGLFGVGGGLIMVPALVLVLPAHAVPVDEVMRVAIGTSLAVIALTSLSSTLAHARHGGLHWPVFRRITPGLLLGAGLGAVIDHSLSGPTLQAIVGVAAWLAALQMAFKRARQDTGADTSLVPGRVELLAVGSLIGGISAMVGIGGGTLNVPYLGLRGLPMRRAVGTAAACGVPIAWAGAAGFVVTGWSVEGLPGPRLGYVNLAAFAALALASVLVAPLGAKLAHHLSPVLLRRSFALLLLVVGGRLLIH